jgi:hypothetical protein
LNTALPAVAVDLQRAFQDKMKTYEQADKDSVRRGQYQRLDPYRKDSLSRAAAGFPDPRAEQLERRLASLQQASLRQESLREASLRQAVRSSTSVYRSPALLSEKEGIVAAEPAPDPQLDRLNVLLDKVIRIQHPLEATAGARTPVAASGRAVEEVQPADSGVNSIAALVPEDQTLVGGGTITLRIMDSIRVVGRVVPAGELVYGTVTVNGDRLLVHVGSLREGRNLYAMDWQVVDLDGLVGIHIPGLLGRDVAKQSADQGVNSLNLMTLDPSLGAQAAGAGIQAAKSFLGRKVRQVRVTVRAGYQVLLRNPHSPERGPAGGVPPGERKGSVVEPPEWNPDGPVVEQCRNEGVELRLRAVCIRDSCLWFGLEWRNRSPIDYSAAYLRWTIRDRRVFRRTALQEQGLEPLVASALPVVGGDCVVHQFAGFRPFALSRDKQLVLEVGEKGGGRTLVLMITHKDILKARNDAKASQ